MADAEDWADHHRRAIDEWVGRWTELQRAACLDWLAVVSGYRARDPRNRWHGAGAEMVATLQESAAQLVAAEAEWARSWNAEAPESKPAAPRRPEAGDE